jgi:2-keto-3-deoxy-L-fuconate dehydrogenase
VTVGAPLENKTAVVTAAARGIGRAIAEKFAQAGASVIATDIDRAGLNGLPATVRCERLDATNEKELAALSADIGRVSILVNCAGIVHKGAILDCSERSWSDSLEVNCASQFRAIKAFLPGMLRAFTESETKSSIINIASVASSIKGVPDRFAYTVSKAAIVGLTKSIARDYIRSGIRCNAIAPGTIDTPSLQDRINAEPDPIKARAEFIARQPMGRLGRPEEIAELATYMASDVSSFMTGTVVVIDGGHSL